MNADPEPLPIPKDPEDLLQRRVLHYFDSAPPTPGAVGRYAVLDHLGAGGMGLVLKARDAELRRDVALKLIRAPGDGSDPGDRVARLRFLREAWITGRLEHPNIVPVHELGRDRVGRAYYTMKLVHGRTLSDVIRRLNERDPATEREFGPGELLAVVLKVCDAITFAHAQGVVHRDLKPANVMVGSFGEVLVMDWGLARVADQLGDDAASGKSAGEQAAPTPDTGLATLPGQVLGTPGYMAPEQAAGQGAAIDERTDVFGLGAILYHLLSGNPPYSGHDSQEILAQARAAQLADPGMLRAHRPVARELVAVCRKAMAARREERYPSVAALAADLRAFLEARTGSAWRDGLAQRLVKQVRRHPVRATALAGLALLGLALVAAVSQYRAAAAEGTARRDAEDRRKTAEQAGQDRSFLEALSVLQSQDLVGLAWQRCSDLDALARYLDTYDRHGVAVEQGADPGQVWAQVAGAATRLPELGHALVDGLFDLATRLERSGVLHAARLQAGEPSPPWAGEKHLASFRSVGAEQRRLLRFWPRLQAILMASPDPWRREVFRAWFALVTEAADRFEPLLAEASLRERTGAELAWLALRVHPTRGHEVAAGLLDRAIALEPGWFQSRLNRGLIALQTKDLGRAFLEYQVGLALEPDSVALRANLGVALAERGELPAAEATFRRAIELDSSYAVPHLNLGTVLAHRGDLEGAVASFGQAVALEPDFTEAWANLGSALQRLDRLREALAALLRAVELGPTFAMAHYNLGLVRMALGDVPGAIAAYREALRHGPEEAESWCNLGHALVRKGAFGEGAAALRRGHALGVKRPGWKYESARWVREATRLAERESHLIAVAEDREAPEDGEDAARAALVAHDRGRFARAARLYQEALAADQGLAGDLNAQHRTQAARAAVQAAAGRGLDAGLVSAEERTSLLRQACQWLREELDAWTGSSRRGATHARRARLALQRWLEEPELEPVRGAADLSPDWVGLWRDVRQALATLEPAR